MINFFAFACFHYHMVCFCSGEGGRENCFTYNANTSAPLCWKILIFWVFITKAVEIKGVKSLAWKSGGVNFLTNLMSGTKYNFVSASGPNKSTKKAPLYEI